MNQTNMTNGVFVPSQAEGNSPFITSFSDTAEFERLPDGLYQAVIAGVIAKDYHKFKSETEMVTKVSFIIQCSHNSETFYFRTAPYTHTLGSKSNLMTFIQTSTGATLEKLKEKFPMGFPLERMIGVPVQIVVTTNVNDDGKSYSNLANTLKAPRGANTPIIPDAIPAYLVRNTKFFQLAEGLTVKEDTQAKKAEFPQGLPGGINSQPANPIPDNINDNLPGFTPQQPAPKKTPKAKITQNQNPAAFMGQGQNTLQVTNPAPQPAGPDVVTAEQVMAAEGIDDDSDDSLPF